MVTKSYLIKQVFWLIPLIAPSQLSPVAKSAINFNRTYSCEYSSAEGFEKRLELVGIGFRSAISGNKLQLNIGYSHQVIFDLVDDVKVECASPTEIVVSGIDKQKVGEFAANIRAARKPEPYKGKGIRYKGEYVRRKEGKTAGKK